MKTSYKLIILGVLIILALVAITYGGSGYKAWREGIVSEKEKIIKELEKSNIEDTKEKERLYKLDAEKDRKIALLDNQNETLKNQIKNIIVPSNPNDLVDAWGKRGIKSRVIRSMPPPGR